MERIVKKFDKNSGVFISTKIDLSEIIKNNPSMKKEERLNLSRFKQNIFIDQKDIDIINSLKRKKKKKKYSFYNR